MHLVLKWWKSWRVCANYTCSHGSSDALKERMAEMEPVRQRDASWVTVGEENPISSLLALAQSGLGRW